MAIDMRLCILCLCLYCCLHGAVAWRWDYVKTQYNGSEHIFRYALKDAANADYDNSQPYSTLATSCRQLTENGEFIFAPLNDTRAADAFTDLVSKNVTLSSIINDKELCTNWSYTPMPAIGANSAPQRLVWNSVGPKFTPRADHWNPSGAAIDNTHTLVVIRKYNNKFYYAPSALNIEMYTICEYFPLPNSSASPIMLCSAASVIANDDDNTVLVNQSYCVHSEKPKQDVNYKMLDSTAYSMYCEKGGGRLAQAESEVKRTKLWAFLNTSVLNNVVNNDNLLLSLMIDTGLTNWRQQNMCKPRVACRTNLNHDAIKQDRTRGMIMYYRWKDQMPKEVNGRDYNPDTNVLCTAIVCPDPHLDSTLTSNQVTCPNWNNSVSAQNRQRKKTPLQQIDYFCILNYVLSGTETFANGSGIQVTTRRCTQDAVWDSGVPVCVSPSCRDMPAFPNDTANIASYTINGVTTTNLAQLTTHLGSGSFRPADRIRFSCKSSLSGSSQTSTCQSGGTWSPVTMSCTVGFCGGSSQPPIIPNSIANSTLGNASWEGISIKFTCHVNYSIGGIPGGGNSFVISCINSSWTYFGNLSCQPTACSALPVGLGNSTLYDYQNPSKIVSSLPANGIAVSEGIFYECQPGFVGVPSPTRQHSLCQLGGHWYPPVTRYCQLLNCTLPEAMLLQPHVTIMQRVNSSFIFVNSSHLPYTTLVRLSCQPPYFPMPGSSDLTRCVLSDSNPMTTMWKSDTLVSTFSCYKYCNNSILQNLVGYGQAVFTATQFTQPDSTANVTCQSNAFAPMAMNLTLNGQPSSSFLVTCSAGDWTIVDQLVTGFLCLPKPCLLPRNLTHSTVTPTNNLGSITGTDGQIYLPVNSTMNVTCWPNTRLASGVPAATRMTSCQLGPYWLGDLDCQPIRCPEDNFIPGLSDMIGPLNTSSMLNASGPYLIGDQVVFRCKNNIYNSVLITCQTDANFTASWRTNATESTYCSETTTTTTTTTPTTTTRTTTTPTTTTTATTPTTTTTTTPTQYGVLTTITTTSTSTGTTIDTTTVTTTPNTTTVEFSTETQLFTTTPGTTPGTTTISQTTTFTPTSTASTPSSTTLSSVSTTSSTPGATTSSSGSTSSASTSSGTASGGTSSSGIASSGTTGSGTTVSGTTSTGTTSTNTASSGTTSTNTASSGTASSGTTSSVITSTGTRTSTLITTFADTTTVSPVSTTTTPYVPLRAFPPVIENRYRINYWATCNHYWQFSDDLKSTDQGSSNTFVRDQVMKRRDYFQRACNSSMASPTAIPLDPTCCVACQDEDLLINVPGYNVSDNITKALNRDIPDTVAVDVGLDSTDSRALKLVGAESTCIRLGFISEDAPYSRKCLQQPEKCDYGLSASLWVNFTSDSYLKEILLSTWSGSTSQGFQFYTDSGKLTVLIVGAKGRWTASIDNFDKKVGKWRLLGFTWERSTGIIQIYIDSVVQVFYFQATYTEPNAQGDAATLISMGCEFSASGSSSSYLRAIVIHPAIWLWPIQQENLILLTGALVYKLIRYQAPATTAVPTTAPKPSFAYSSVLREVKFELTDANPFYTMAQYYIRAVDLQNNVSMLSHNITVTADAQSRSGISLAHFKFTDSPAVFNIEGLSGCIGDFNACADGISMSVWIGAFQTLLSTQMEILRFNIFSVSVYNSSGNVMLQVQARARKITTVVAYRKWINVGCIYDMRGSTPMLTLYVNGILRDSTTADVGSGSSIGDVKKVTLGSSTAPTGALFNDFAVWYRSLEDFEVHKFLGYTRDQLRAIRDATHYWTNDQFVLADGMALTGTPSYNLRSQFRSNVGGVIGSAIKFEDDRHNKSLAMTLDKNVLAQIFLGNEFSPTPTETSIMWYGTCLTDPFQRQCQIKGLSMHMWINIKAIDTSKKQFFFNSGDLGDARSSTLDSRGISLFTTGNLLGVSLSTDRNDWAIVIDSNRYKLNEWFNLGFTWRTQEGMRLFLNGTDYGIKNQHPDISYKAYDKHTRAVVGRFDNDQNVTWTTNREWVMGNFSYMDIVFFERWLSPDEMSQSVGSSNNRYFVTADLFVFGEEIIDTSFLLMKQAWLYGVPIGPQGSVSKEWQIFAKICTNGQIGIKAYKADECPRSLSACKYQVLFSTWIQILSKDNGTTITLLSLGSDGGVNEGFGLNINQDNTLTAWVKRANFKFVTKTSTKVRMNRWLNVGLHLTKTHFHPTIYINGTNVSVTLDRTTNNNFQSNTAASTLKIGPQSLGPNPNCFLVYTVSGWYNNPLPSNQMNTMLGMQSSQYDLMGLSDEYWAMSGLWNKLQPRKIEGFNTQNNPDKYDMENGAMCTLGAGGSYISLGDLEDTCLVNSTLCKAFILTFNMKPQMPKTPGRAYIFSAGGQNAGNLGTAISVTHDGFIYVTVRSPNKTCEMKVPFNYSDWMQLQVRWYTDAPMSIKVDEETISRRAGTNNTCWQESNSNITYTKGHLGKVNSNTTNAIASCFSDVMFVYQLVGSGGSLEVDVAPTNCYQQQTAYLGLHSGELNYENKVNRSQKFVASHSIQMAGTDVCFLQGAGCTKGLVMSLWLRIDVINDDSEVFNSGFPGSQGIRIIAKKMDSRARAYTIAVDSSFNGKTRYVEGSKDTDQLAIGTWVNIGVSATADVLEIYQNGISTRATTKFTADTLSLPTGIVSLGSSSMTMLASDLVFWNDPPLNCLVPNKNRKILTGDCTTSTLELKTTCLPEGASTCQTTFENNMCLDSVFDNVISIDKRGQLFTSMTDATTACKVIRNTATDKGYKAEFVQSSLNILTRISDNLAVSVAIDNDTLNNTMGDFSRAFSSVMDPKFSDKFKSLLSDGTVNPASIFSSVEGMALRLAAQITTDCSPAILTAGRMHWSTQKIGPGCSSKPVNSLRYTDSTRATWTSADDEMFIPSSLFAGRSGVKVACVVYDQIDNLVQSVATNETNFSNMTNSTVDLTVNSRIISVKTSLPAAALVKLEDPLNITLVLTSPNQKKRKDTTLQFETRCAFWDTGVKKWSTQGCVKVSEDENAVKCNCYHMTSFAILMQPVPQTQDNIHAKILSILTYVLIGISLFCLLIFIVVIACSKKLRGERYIIHLNLAGALFVAQLAFVFTDMAQNNESFCKAIAIVMHLFFVATFTMLFIEALWVFYAVTKGIIRGRLKWWLPIGWLIPVLIVAVVCGMNINAYGGNRCWINGIFIWSFLGPLVGFGSLTLLVCLIVICNLKEPAIKRKDILNDLRNHTHQCAFLIPFMILAWLFGVILVQWYSIPIEYFFVIFNASQGFWVFLFFGLTNPDFKEVICLRRGRSSVGSSSVSITHGVQDISSSNASFDTGSKVAIVPSKTSPKQQKGKQPAQPQPPQLQKQSGAPVYHTGKEKKKPQKDEAEDAETTSSQARLKTSARSVRTAASSRGELRGEETDADRPYTPRNEKFTPPGTVD